MIPCLHFGLRLASGRFPIEPKLASRVESGYKSPDSPGPRAARPPPRWPEPKTPRTVSFNCPLSRRDELAWSVETESAAG